MVQPNYKDRYSSAELALDALISLEVLAPSQTRKFTKIILTSILGFLAIGSSGFTMFIVYSLQLNKSFESTKIEYVFQVLSKRNCFNHRK